MPQLLCPIGTIAPRPSTVSIKKVLTAHPPPGSSGRFLASQASRRPLTPSGHRALTSDPQPLRPFGRFSSLNLGSACEGNVWHTGCVSPQPEEAYRAIQGRSESGNDRSPHSRNQMLQSVKGGFMTATRIEHDSLGPVTVPGDKLWGAQTQRSLEHFNIGD